MSEAQAFLSGDPFEGPEEDERARPWVLAGYDGECGVCFGDFDAGDLIRALPGGDGCWESQDHGHEYDPAQLLPSEPVPVHRVGQHTVLPPHAPYAVPEEKTVTDLGELPGPLTEPPTDAELYEALGSGHPEVESEASHLLGMSMEERRAFLNPGPLPEGTGMEAGPLQFTCAECGKVFAPTKDKRVRKHNDRGREVCPGSRSVPVELVEAAVADPGEEAVAVLDAVPSNAAQEAAARVAAGQGPGPNPHRPRLGDLFIPPGQFPFEETALGGLFKEAVGDPGTVLDLDDAAEVMYRATVLGDRALMQGTDPVTVAAWTPERDAHLYVPRPPEPEPDRDKWDRYLLPHPQTGASTAWRRATTLAGVLDDTYNLDLWQKRHLLRGAALASVMAPGELAWAAEADVSADKDRLNALAQELAERSGVTEAADAGTLVHSLTEAVDRARTGQERSDALARVPDRYRADVAAYEKALEEAGLRTVPSLLERRTVVLGYGAPTRYTGPGIAGTFDQVLQAVRDLPRYGLRAGDFVIGDKKTGKDMSYGEQSHCIQLSLYADGVNSSGVWDGHTRQWTRPVRVSPKVGVIIHLPLEKGECTLHVMDLEEGRRMARLAQDVLDSRKPPKGKAWASVLHTASVPAAVPQPVQQPVPATDPMAVWKARVREVRTKEDASRVYTDAQAAGMPADLLGHLVQAMQAVLSYTVAPAPAAPEPPTLEARARGVVVPEQASALFLEAQATPGMTRERLDDLIVVMQAALADEPPF